jgi:RimJ/RimL family protein N-acetyltransferase
MNLNTTRFLIRPLAADDAALHVSEWTLDALAAEMLNVSQTLWPVGEQKAFFARNAMSPSQHLLGIWGKEEHKLIGLFIVEPQPNKRTFTLTMIIGEKKWRGRGVTAEVSDALYDHYFNKLSYAKAKANVRPHNRAMLWIMANGAWRKEAHLVKHLRDKSSNTRVDVLVMGLLAEDWRKNVRTRRKQSSNDPSIEGAIR